MSYISTTPSTGRYTKPSIPRRHNQSEYSDQNHQAFTYATQVYFTEADKTEKRFSANDIYRHAAMVLRDRHKFFANRRVVFPNATGSNVLEYTLEQMSKYVANVVQDAEDDMYFYLESRRTEA